MVYSSRKSSTIVATTSAREEDENHLECDPYLGGFGAASILLALTVDLSKQGLRK
jgi:hypothetical protein